MADAAPCFAPGCKLPSRFVLGIVAGTRTYWCVAHVMPRGVEWLGGLVEGIRAVIEPAIPECVICGKPGTILCEEHQ